MAEPVIVTPPAVEPVTLAAAKLHLRVEFPDEDTLITGLIAAARQRAETHAGRVLVNTVFDWTLDGWYGSRNYPNPSIALAAAMAPGLGIGFWHAAEIRPPGTPLVSVQSITYYDTSGTLQTLAPSAYQVIAGTPGRIVPAYPTPWPPLRPWPGSVTIRYTAGYSADASLVPQAAKTAILLMVGGWYLHREHIDKGRPRDVPSTVEWLLDTLHSGGYR